MSKEDDDQEGAGNLGVGRYPCMPSLVALQQMKNRLHLANLGKKLMKWTALATGKEIRRVAADLVLEYEDFASDIANCYILLARSRFYYPNLNKMVIEDVQNEATITVSSTVKSISAGVRGYMYEISESEKPSYPYLGIDRGGQIILETKIAWANLLKKMIMILQHRNTYEALEYANKAATKKQNVLGKLVIPKLVKSMKYILSEIEELAREDNFRLKTFKKSKLKLMAAKGKAVICSCCQNIFELGILKEIDNENLTCPNCAKGNAVSAKVMVCDNVGDKVMKYLEEHKDEIKEWANAAESVLNKPCCNIKELPNALPGVCLPETLDVSFMNKVEEIPEPTKELPPVETEPLPEIEELPELCHTCSFKPPSVCIVKPESCTKPVPCTKSEICTESEPCGMPDPCKGKLKVNASTEPDQTSCVACKASTLDDKPCVACLKEKQYLEDLLGSCIPCIINQKTSPYDGHKNIKFPVNQEGQTATGASTPCSISSRMASASSRMSSKLGMSDNSDIVEKVVRITRKINYDGTVDEQKQIIIKTKLTRTGDTETSSLKSRSLSRSQSRSESIRSRVKYVPSDTGTVPCSCQYLSQSECIEQYISHSNVDCDCGYSSNKLESIFNILKTRHDKAVSTSAPTIVNKPALSQPSVNKQVISQPSGDQNTLDTQSDVLKQSSQMYDPKIRSCISVNEMFSFSELAPSSCTQIPFKSEVLRTAKSQMLHRITRKESSYTKQKKEEDNTNEEREGSGKKPVKSQKIICDPAFVSIVRKDNKLMNKVVCRNTRDSKLLLGKPSESKENGKDYSTKLFNTEYNDINDSRKVVSISMIEQVYKKQFDESPFKTKLSVSANNVNPCQTICKDCLKELSGYIPPRTDFEQSSPDCKYCQIKIKEHLTKQKDSGTSPDSKSSIFLSCTSASISLLGQTNVDLVSSHVSLKVKKSTDTPMDVVSSNYDLDQEPGFSYRIDNDYKLKHNLQTSNAPQITTETIVETQKDDSIAGAYTTNKAHKIGLDTEVDSLMGELYRDMTTEQKILNLNDLPLCLSSLSYEINESQEGTSQQKGTLQKCKCLHSVDQHSCSATLLHFEDDSKNNNSKYKTKYELRNILVTQTNLLETSPQSSPDTSGATTPKSSEVKEKDKQTGFETNESETRTCLCQGSEIQEDEKKGNRKPVEPTLYRRVRENDPTVYKHSTETEPDIKPITTAKQCGIMIRERSNHGQDLDKQTKKFCATSSEVESSSKLCREKTPICSYKSCKERIGVVDPDLKVVVQEMCCKESATNNITREFGTPLSSHDTCVNRASKTEVKSKPKSLSEPQFKEASTNTKRSGKYDVRNLSQMPKLVIKSSLESVTECKPRVLKGTTSCQGVSRISWQDEKCETCLKCCKSCSSVPRRSCNIVYNYCS